MMVTARTGPRKIALNTLRLQGMADGTEFGDMMEEIKTERIEEGHLRELLPSGPFIKEERWEATALTIDLLTEFRSLANGISRRDIWVSSTRLGRLTTAISQNQKMNPEIGSMIPNTDGNQMMDQEVDMGMPKENRKLALAIHLSIFLWQNTSQSLILQVKRAVTHPKVW